ncbi:MAG TPA: hypothetical protein VLU95_02995 [Candidatus Acidoferrum sp.]|nr:hypothetical protein [Candidatus Acidoferrum sp.]
MFDGLKKDQNAESNKKLSTSNVEKPSQKNEELQTTDQAQKLQRPQITKSPEAEDNLNLLASLQKIKSEEKELQEQRQRLQTKEKSLQGKVVEEIEKKRADLDDLKSEISDIQGRCKELSQALGVSTTDIS